MSWRVSVFSTELSSYRRIISISNCVDSYRFHEGCKCFSVTQWSCLPFSLRPSIALVHKLTLHEKSRLSLRQAIWGLVKSVHGVTQEISQLYWIFWELVGFLWRFEFGFWLRVRRPACLFHAGFAIDQNLSQLHPQDVKIPGVDQSEAAGFLALRCHCVWVST